MTALASLACLTHGSSPVSPGGLGVADPAEKVLVDLEVLLGTVLRDACLDGYALLPGPSARCSAPCVAGRISMNRRWIIGKKMIEFRSSM